MKYYIEVNEQRCAVFAVEAECEEDAINKVAAAYDAGSIEMDEEDTGCVGYLPVRNKEALERIVAEGRYTELPEDPTTYTVEYTLTVEWDGGESTDYICKAEEYASVGEVKDESAELIKGLIRDHGIPDGMYEVEMGISAIKGGEETHEDWDSMVVVVSDGAITFRDDWGPEIPDKSEFFEALSEDEKKAGYIKFNIPRFNDIYATNGEGVWGWVTPEDKAKYDDDSYTGEITAILCNDPLYYSYKLKWGAEVVLKCHGSSRPTLDPEWIKKYLL